ncbi:adenylosuccinate lyase [Bacteriovorax stolpii]|uniref:Adenylosuccinate lyase n=1 Tax=Bacteriovorax stolpii TaxID=960 RepID=A0A2K9NQN1_BACTC|nr:adenylosuccinate lyase [Bacteriovorax stolpii]AUN97840.1 adenylosuccinate lyase [Bacteriovorax stolpii]QDK42174.1 adenylosuccinate lyase [Bacteriovorax stolpii]TDP51667.1 adenylosuccinate lyase [Bacteriovorax stolpii]
MIPRYEAKAITPIWSDENKFKTFLQIELELLSALEEKKMIPSGISKTIRDTAKINTARIDEIELTTRHDVIAFCTSITEQLPTEIGKYFHYGVTSSDVIDSALTLQIKASLEVVMKSYDSFMEALKLRALETKMLMTLGRSHGMYAEPMSFGQKLLGHYAEFKRRREDLEHFYKNELTIQLSGAVGNYTILTPDIEESVAKKLGVKVEDVSTQIIPRDRLAKLISITSLVANAIERLAVEIRHLHHSDVKEVAEGFRPGQKGSSTMPHKKNPIASENLTGLSRFLRSHLTLALENSILWHERDISHSSAERLYLPDHFGILTYALDRFTTTLNLLDIDEKVVEAKVLNHTHYLSSFYLHFLIKNCESLTREDLYAVVQAASFDADAKTNPQRFRDLIQNELKTRKETVTLPEVNADGLRNIYLKSVDQIFNRVL